MPGQFGPALQFHGLMALDYPGPGNINLSAGRLEFWVALDFNTVEVKDPGVRATSSSPPSTALA